MEAGGRVAQVSAAHTSGLLTLERRQGWTTKGAAATGFLSKTQGPPDARDQLPRPAPRAGAEMLS